MKKDIYIMGESVIIKSVTEKEIDDYLYIKRFATMIAPEFDRLDGFWEYMKQIGRASCRERVSSPV